MWGKLNKSLYGTRDAARNWEAAYTEFMVSIGFEVGTPCTFYHEEKDVRAAVHGDDFTMLGSRSGLDWFKGKESRTSSRSSTKEGWVSEKRTSEV